ncbi:hypothetical protein UFOVP1356_2 [uncultured Caudovirales phage]|uniref:Uncharacterized protein n=1 Tax=uncultured Caudovirales phage TaxID=2100421 RepID=A0A6J5RUL9_9CAUD|nr:hypothetical protein UFOVP1356_2 [uncultured Caudovirales phage]
MSYETDDRYFNVMFTIMLAIVHGGFWLGVGLAAGRLLWGMP